jgi:hypothetical protein
VGNTFLDEGASGSKQFLAQESRSLEELQLQLDALAEGGYEPIALSTVVAPGNIVHTLIAKRV